MAIKLSSEDLAALNIGESQVSRGYIGTTEIYPNDIAITSAGYDDPSIARAGGNTGYTVTGNAGAQYYFNTNSNYGTSTGTVSNMPGSSNVQTMGSSGTATYTPSIGTRGPCNVPAAIPGTNTYNQIQIVPVSPTIMAAGVSQYDYIAQAAGPNYGAWQTTITPTITVIDSTTVDVGGTKYWAANTAKWNVKFAWSSITPNPSQGGSTFSNFHWADGTDEWMRGISIDRVTNPSYPSVSGWARTNLQNNAGLLVSGSTPTWFYYLNPSTSVKTIPSGEISCDVTFPDPLIEATFSIWWQGSVSNGGGAYSSCWSMNGSSPAWNLYQVNLGSVSTGVAT